MNGKAEEDGSLFSAHATAREPKRSRVFETLQNGNEVGVQNFKSNHARRLVVVS
jgi:hypothetical protein